MSLDRHDLEFVLLVSLLQSFPNGFFFCRMPTAFETFGVDVLLIGFLVGIESVVITIATKKCVVVIDDVDVGERHFV